MNWSIPRTVGGDLFPMVFGMLAVKLGMILHGPFALEEGAVPVIYGLGAVRLIYGLGGGIGGIVAWSMVEQKRIILPREEVRRLLGALLVALPLILYASLAALVGGSIGYLLFGPLGIWLAPVAQLAAVLLSVLIIV